MKAVRENIEKMEAQLKVWDARLDVLLAKAEAVHAGAKADYRRHIEELREKHRLARAKLTELKAAGDDKWEIMKKGVESAWNDLEAALKKLKD